MFRPGLLKTTAMGIMPMRDPEKAFDLILTLDIPFWPQLPNMSYFEDMYVQASEYFPGIVVDTQRRKIFFKKDIFERELDGFFERLEDPDAFSISEAYSLVYRKFLDMDLSQYFAIRGQVTGPISFGFNVLDENLKPIIYDDDVRPLLFAFLNKKVNVQIKELKKRHERAFVWVDEPGLGYIFSGLTGYTDEHARRDYSVFFSEIEGLRGMHLCANVDLNFLLSLDIDILSFDAFQIEFIHETYAKSIKAFIEKGGVIVYGIVPSDSLILSQETPTTISNRLLDYFETIHRFTGLEVKDIATHALIAPSRCCLKDMYGEDEEEVVEKVFLYLREVSSLLKEKLSL